MNEIFHVSPEPPFNDYTKGRVYISQRDNRRCISLSGGGPDTFTTTYARYLFQVDYWNKFSQMIPEEYEVDHINEDKFDDRLENFQLLTSRQNRIKNNTSKGLAYCVLVCPMCGTLFRKRPYNLHNNAIHVCSNLCYRSLKMSVLTNTLSDYFVNNQLKYQIRVHQSYPIVSEKMSEILKHFPNCFYPKSLFGETGSFPKDILEGSHIVSFNERIVDLLKFHKMGMSQVNIAKELNISKDQVEHGLKQARLSGG